MDKDKTAGYYGVIIGLVIFIVGATGLFIYAIVYELDISRNGKRVVGKIYKIKESGDSSNDYYIRFNPDSVGSESLVTIINDSAIFYYVKESGRAKFVVDSGFTIYFFWPIPIITLLAIWLVIGLRNPGFIIRHSVEGDSGVSE
jgi:hypothetical protein